MQFFRAVFKLLVIAAVASFYLLANLVLALRNRKLGLSVPVYRFLTRLIGLNIRTTGNLADADKPVLFVANHLSYLDIVALNSLMPCRFVAKSEVSRWPVFGALAKAQNTVFITRTRTALDAAKRTLADILKAGGRIVVFAEGTSTNGLSVKPFKPGLFDAVYETGVEAFVQPVAIVLEKVDAKPAGGDGEVRNMYAWWRLEDTLAPHLWSFLAGKGADISIHFLPPLDPAGFPDRKKLASAAHALIAEKVEAGESLGYNPASDVPVAQLDRAPVS